VPKGARSGAGGLSVDIKGLDVFLRDLKKFEPEVSKDFRKRLRSIIDKVAKDAQRRAPKKTGKLSRGIKPSVTNKGAKVVSKAPHAKLFEFGGRHPVYGNKNNWVFQPAKPYLFPAARENQELVNTEALAALDHAIGQIGFH
jgi:HK97 gp10 family phage protein